ncbi:uncharacterized protein ACA1_182930 [Acanthamoeba castellanii str. Neff]|uniref:Uncharacterized protein n=1 Tax=Acanthamoeba castellanii (strain ATCC 30010 / Neff) TaxID=1257118 RepID=L8H747_ACACF|nr:uncharacterized protein ACA1_182930 [Acanthamoeba castellanii str. Neff]ELR21359.1 hypothetical protein ACA1_182930 [Acanthamoeba castellanii str. Neff]
MEAPLTPRREGISSLATRDFDVVDLSPDQIIRRLPLRAATFDLMSYQSLGSLRKQSCAHASYISIT